MSRLPVRGSSRYTIRLYDDDMEFLKENFPTTNPTEIIRTLVHQQVKKLREKQNVTGNAKPFENRAGFNIDTLFEKIHNLGGE